MKSPISCHIPGAGCHFFEMLEPCRTGSQALVTGQTNRRCWLINLPPPPSDWQGVELPSGGPVSFWSPAGWNSALIYHPLLISTLFTCGSSQNDPGMIPEWSRNDPRMTLKWSRNDPEMIPEWRRNDPVMFPQWPRNHPDWSRNDPRMILEWPWNDPGMIPEWPRNDPRMTLEWPLSEPKFIIDMW